MKLIALDHDRRELANYDLDNVSWVLDEKGFTLKEPLKITVKKSGTITRVIIEGKKTTVQFDTNIVGTFVREGDYIHIYR